MKSIFINTILLLLIIAFQCQREAPVGQGKITNSFKGNYERTNPNLHYSYEKSTQTHNYSDNWDFDGDGIKDKLFFVGNNGVHLYFHLKVILISDNQIRNYQFIEIDYPYLGTFEELQTKNKCLDIPSKFLVYDFDSDGLDEIVINLDNSTFTVFEKELNKYSINSKCILLDFKGKNILLKEYMD